MLYTKKTSLHFRVWEINSSLRQVMQDQDKSNKPYRLGKRCEMTGATCYPRWGIAASMSHMYRASALVSDTLSELVSDTASELVSDTSSELASYTVAE